MYRNDPRNFLYDFAFFVTGLKIFIFGHFGHFDNFWPFLNFARPKMKKVFHQLLRNLITVI